MRFSASLTRAVKVVFPQLAAVTLSTTGWLMTSPLGVIVSPKGNLWLGSPTKTTSPLRTASFWVGLLRLFAVEKKRAIGVVVVTCGPPTEVASRKSSGIW